MLSPFRFAAIITVIFAVCGWARSQELAPPGSDVSIHKVIIETGFSHTVKYVVKGGSPRLQALVRRVEWAENELSVIEQMQLLKLDTVVNERHLAAFRTAQLTNPYFPPGFGPLSFGVYNGHDGKTSLQRALNCQLAYEATPQAALQMIGFLEKMQTELDAQLKAVPPQEKKAAEGSIDALRPRLAALSRAGVPPPGPQPVVPRRALEFSPVYQEQMGTPGPMAAPAGAKAAVEVEWGGSWYAAEILRVSGRSSLIHYSGWSSSFDEWVPLGRIRPAGTVRGVQRQHSKVGSNGTPPPGRCNCVAWNSRRVLIALRPAPSPRCQRGSLPAGGPIAPQPALDRALLGSKAPSRTSRRFADLPKCR